MLSVLRRDHKDVQLDVPTCDSGIRRVLYLFQTKVNKDGENQEVEIARCHKGQYFGELALVTNKPRAASAYAVGDVKCLGKKDALCVIYLFFPNMHYFFPINTP